MTRLRSLIKEVLSTPPKKKDCNCGCGGCDKKAPIITEGRIKKAISEGLTYHVENKIPLHESVYRIGSEKHFELINEARKLWVRGLIDVSEDDQAILETHLGNFGMYEGEKVPLDMPMVNEEKEYYVTYNKGRGQGKGLVKSKESNYEEPRVFSKEEAEEYAKEAESRSRQMTAYWVSDKDMNRLNEGFKDYLGYSEPKMPSQEEVDEFFSITQNEMHYLNSKPVMGQKGDRVRSEIEPWDEYDLSNWNALVRKAKAQGKINEGFYFQPSDMEDSGLNVIPKDQRHASKMVSALEDSGLHAEWNAREGHFFFPEEEDGYDQLEMDIQDLMDENNIQGYIEGVFEESLNEVHKLLRQTNLSSEEYQKAKKLKGFNADNYTFSSDNNLYVKKESVDEVDRYSGFNRNPEDPDSVPFEPKGSVAQFKEDLRALFGKFKGDLKNPEFIKGVAEIMVNWKSLLRSQLDEAKKKKDPPLNKPKRGGSKAYYVYVRDPKTKKIKKVSFGSGGLRAKIKNKEARNAFAARHNCKNKKDRTKAGYWSCNLPRYADQLGLGSKMNTFW